MVLLFSCDAEQIKSRHLCTPPTARPAPLRKRSRKVVPGPLVPLGLVLFRFPDLERLSCSKARVSWGEAVPAQAGAVGTGSAHHADAQGQPWHRLLPGGPEESLSTFWKGVCPAQPHFVVRPLSVGRAEVCVQASDSGARSAATLGPTALAAACCRERHAALSCCAVRVGVEGGSWPLGSSGAAVGQI